MSKMDKLTALKIVRTYIAGGVTMQTLADSYGVSKTTIVRLLNGEGSVELDDDILSQIAEVRMTRSQEVRHKEGRQRKKIISPDVARRMATTMINDGLTLADLHTEGGPSIGTIYNAFTRENLGPDLYARVIEHYALNKAQATRSCPNNICSNAPKIK